MFCEAMIGDGCRRRRKAIGATAARALGASAVALLTLVSGAGGAAAQDGGDAPETGEGAFRQFSGCIAGTGVADILLVMDESGSLVGMTGDRQDPALATDPDGLRVDAAQDFVRQMARYSEESGAEINVRLAGFGEGYNPAGDWATVTAQGKGTNLDDAIEDFRDRTDEGWTDYEAGLQGAAGAFEGRGDSCRAVMFFSDGAPTRAPELGGSESVMPDVCSADGPVGRLRASGIQLFTIGLSANDGGDVTANMAQMSEGSDCSNGAPNGAHIDASDARGLFAAFRTMVPEGASLTRKGVPVRDATAFVLDDSVSPVSISAFSDGGGLPDPGSLVPVLTPPNGEPVELTAETRDVGGNPVTVTLGDESAGMVDIDMERGGGEWAGEWSFGYVQRGEVPGDATYRVAVTIVPGLRIAVDGSDEQAQLAKSNDETIRVQLLRPDGTPAALDGEATLDASIAPSDGGGPVTLVEGADIRSGAVDVPLEAVDGRLAGRLDLSVNITTAPAGDIPGTALGALDFAKPISVAPSTVPKLPGSIDLDIHGTDGETRIPVSGPGKVWIEPGSFVVGDATVDYEADHDASSPLELGRGESGVIVLRATTGDAIDRVIDGAAVTLVAEDAESGVAEEVDVPVRGSMHAPVDATTFGIALVLALLLALLIPLGVLYLMKYVTGRIPTSPGVHAIRVPVAVEGGRLLRTDRGGDFDLSHDEVIHAPRVTSSGRSIDLAGERISVRTGLNPFEAPMAVAASPNSISDDGARAGGAARLPLAVHNHWLAIVDPPASVEPDTGFGDWGVPAASTRGPAGGPTATLIVAVDENANREQLARIVEDIRNRCADRITTVAESAAAQPPTSPDDGGKKRRGKGKRGTDAGGPGSGGGPTDGGGHSPEGTGPMGGPGHSQGGFGSGPSQGGFGAGPSQGGFGGGPSQGGFGSGPSQGGFGGGPSQGGFGSGPSQGGFGSGPSQGGFGAGPSQGGFDSGPSQGGFGGGPSQGGFGGGPSQGGFGSGPSQGGFGSGPSQGDPR